MGLLDGQIKNAIASGFRGKLLTATIRKETVTSRDANGDPVTTATNYAAQGARSDYSAFYKKQAGIPDDDVQIILIAGLCDAVPERGDQVKISGAWYQVRRVKIDPASASYELQSFSIEDPTL